MSFFISYRASKRKYFLTQHVLCETQRCKALTIPKYNWFGKEWKTFPADRSISVVKDKAANTASGLGNPKARDHLEVAEGKLLCCTFLALMLFLWKQWAAVAWDRVQGWTYYVPHWGCCALVKSTVTVKVLGKQGHNSLFCKELHVCTQEARPGLCPLLLPSKQIQERSPGESPSM